MCAPSLLCARFGRRQARSRAGAIVLLAAFLIVFLLAMIAFALDLGVILAKRTQLQGAIDAAALAGSGMMAVDPDAAEQVARDYLEKNWKDALAGGEVEIERGTWSRDTHFFLAGGEHPNAVRVFGRPGKLPLFFGRVLGRRDYRTQAEAIATFRPRDIVVVLDYSGSMNDDSELKHIGRLGRGALEANLRQIYQELGSPRIGNLGSLAMTHVSSSNNRIIKRRLGLDRFPFPYPGGSWDDYINYVKSDSDVRNAGYRRHYGYLTFVNYLLDRQPGHHETPDLWKTSEQPITAVKNAVTVFLAFLDETKSGDRVGLSVYTAADGTAILESELTTDLARVEAISRRRQAAHYDRYTNIGAGMEKARGELEQNGRTGAQRLMVLMTDGIANRPHHASYARRYVRDEALRAAEADITIVTISLGTGADKDLMQEVADVTGGTHFNIPGGRSVAEYEEQLKEVFRDIAAGREQELVF